MLRRLKGSRKSPKSETVEHRRGKAFAPLAGERKCISQHGTYMLLQFVFEQTACSMQSCLHRLRHDAEKLSRFLDAHPLDQTRDQDHPEILGKFVDRSLQQSTNFFLSHGCFRIDERRVSKGDYLRGKVRPLFHDCQFHSGTLAPAAPQGFVHDNAGKPGPELRLATEGLDVG